MTLTVPRYYRAESLVVPTGELPRYAVRPQSLWRVLITGADLVLPQVQRGRSREDSKTGLGSLGGGRWSGLGLLFTFP